MSFKQKSSNKPWFGLPGKKERDLSHHKEHYISSFDVIKVNNYGKRQQRTIAVSSQGVSNLNGQTCQWFVKNNDVYNISQDSRDSQKFTLTFLHKYHFEAESAEQAKQIVNEFKRLGVGCKGDQASTAGGALQLSPVKMQISDSPSSSPHVSPKIVASTPSKQQPMNNLDISKSNANVGKSNNMTIDTAKASSYSSNADQTTGLSPLTPTNIQLTPAIVQNTPNVNSIEGARVWKIRAEELKRQLVMKKNNPQPIVELSKLSSSVPNQAASGHANSPGVTASSLALRPLTTSTPTKTPVAAVSSAAPTVQQQTIILLDSESGPNTASNGSVSSSNSGSSGGGSKLNVAKNGVSSAQPTDDVQFYHPDDSDKRRSDNANQKKKKMTIDDFELLKVLGVGSFGRVFLVQKKDNKRLYAMKVLNKKEMMKKKQIAHTNTEKMVLSTMDHPFIVRLHFAFQSDDFLFMCMDYIPGGELFHHLQKAGRFPEELAKFYIAEVISSLDYLHSNNIIYRDIKPENILLDADGHIKLTDFGLSKSGITSVVGSKTGEGGQFATTFCGTPEYLAPEIITGAGHGKAADWWSVGILLFEMLTGRSPFLASNRNDMYKAMIQGNLRLPMFLSADSQNLLERLLVPDPKKRLGSGGVQEIQNHPFFELIPWRLLESKMITPPFKPTIKEIVPQKDDPDLNPAITFKSKRKSSANLLDSPFKNFSWTKEEILEAAIERGSISSSSSPSSPTNGNTFLQAARKSTLKNIRKSSV